MDTKSQIAALLREALERVAPEAHDAQIVLERPRDRAHGDFACNLALQLAKPLKKSPRQLAEALAAAMRSLPAFAAGPLEAVEIAGPGFINLRLAARARHAVIEEVLRAGARYGWAAVRHPGRIQVEFVSANPTGPLHVGHGRQAALGDAIAKLLEAQGHAVTREFYYNDAGAQVHNLTLSVQARAKGLEPGDAGWPAEAYNGEYVLDIASDFLARGTVRAQDGAPVSASGNADDLESIQRFAVTYLRREQDGDLQRLGVKFDVYYLESSLYADGSVAAVVRRFVDNGRTYDKDGALWLRTTDYGDDKDRVVRKSDGSYTYFVPDVAYHLTKWQRSFTRVINVQGSDHHSTVTRVRAGLQALELGIPSGYPDYVLHSMVRVMRGGEEIKISKRAGSYVTVRDLIDWVGRDATRFFLVSRRADTEFVFDVDLALAQSDENPVYYVQYAHARVCSVFAQWGGDARGLRASALDPLAGERELALMQRLAEFPELVQAAAEEFAPHAIAFYLRELAGEFHSYYNAERILLDDERVRAARLALCAAVRQVLANGLALLGVSAPEKM
ncbi:MAG: arginine--tRNA ligase [Betaproteobacteria bacterium RIFCSPLOWO2_02_67_12]|nr:MAG: arginine--tRNA ligase [Betaproteobacteria bacterium RIFCSPLOWO2_02_67_12]OGA29299.1 MAG: arginine--tRNA ligase [Betaproteobacteria bacterium RIFCSPLOWO2_02_FULL_68_150]